MLESRASSVNTGERVAATGTELGLDVATTDVRHDPMLRDLRPPSAT